MWPTTAATVGTFGPVADRVVMRRLCGGLVLAAAVTVSVSSCASQAVGNAPSTCTEAKGATVGVWLNKDYLVPREAAPQVSGFCSPSGPHVGPGRGPDPGPTANANGAIRHGAGPELGARHALIRYVAQNWTGTRVYHNSWAPGSGGAQPITAIQASRWVNSAAAFAHLGQFDLYVGGPDWLGIKASGCVVMLVEVVGAQ